MEANTSTEKNKNVKIIKTAPRKLTSDEEFDYEHPDIIFWTNYFMDEANKRNVFANINATISQRRSKIAAECMATSWYDFTRYVPVFITKAVSMTDDPERQHALIQIAYDELGGRDKNFIHSNLFLEAIEKVSLKITKHTSTSSIREALDYLDCTLTKTTSQYGIVGLLMSFEIIAEENIETLFNCLCYDENGSPVLAATPFFKIHRQDESEHIRHSVSNYLRFCHTDQQRNEFKESFDAGIDFWQRFWDQCARLIILESDLRQSA